MTILRRNLLLSVDDVRLSVLNVDLIRNEVALLDVGNPASWPFLSPLDEVEQDVQLNNFVCEDVEPQAYILDDDLPASWVDYRDKAFNLIKDFVENHAIAYSTKAKIAFVKSVCDSGSASRTTVHKHLQRYWRGGMVRNALLPRFGNCGAPGVEREPGEAKRGRPRNPGGPPGPNTTPKMRRSFRIAINLSYRDNKLCDLTHAYTKCIQMFFCNKILMPDGNFRLEYKEEYRATGVPSQKTFEHYVKKDLCYQALQKARLGSSAYEMRNRAKLDTSVANSWGPGCRYEIDATLVDVTLRSRRCGPHGRKYILGNPVIYVVIDVFSKMIVGVYVGWEHPSWRAAMMAIANIFEDKVEFCKSLGIDITPEEWPCRDKPTVILGDRAEMMSKQPRSMIESLGIAVENTPPYRGDWKGTVESRFHILQHGFRPFVPGSWDRSRQVRGDRDPRVDAVLDIIEFYKIIVDLILYHNNFHIIKDYPRSREMTEAGVPAIPLHIWNWGKPARAGAAKTPHIDKVKFALLWRDTATINYEGVRFRKIRYKCDDPYVSSYFRTEGRRVKTVNIAYDDRNMNVIYLDMRDLIKEHSLIKSREKIGLPTGWVACLMSTGKGDYRDLTEREVEGVKKDEAEIDEGHKEAQILRRAENQARIDQIVQEAREELKALPVQSTSAKLKDIRKNRAEERADRRREESDAFTASFRPTPGSPSIEGFEAPCTNDESVFELPPVNMSDWEAGYEA